MLRLFTRTSTYAVLDLLYKNEEIESVKEIQIELKNKFNFYRKLSDIKSMLKHLERVGLLTTLNFEDFNFKLHPITTMAFRTITYGKNNDVIKGNILDFISYLSEKGLLVNSFLKAVRDHPNKLGMIVESIRTFSKDEGVYNLAIDSSQVSAMRNFFRLFGLLEDRNKHRIYKLTTLGNEIIGKSQITKRSRCNSEDCRKICPANAIHLNYISGCVGCGLCVRACPYGAISFNVNNPLNPLFNSKICKSEIGNQKTASPNYFKYLLSEEIIMQNWIKAIFNLTNLKADIPGVGEFPDLVIEYRPMFIECKNKPIRTQKKINSLIQQIEKYCTKEVIENTIKRVGKHGIKMQNPELFTIIAPIPCKVEEIMKEARERIDMNVTFINSYVFEKMNQYLVEGKNIDGLKILNKLEPFRDSSHFIIKSIKN